MNQFLEKLAKEIFSACGFTIHKKGSPRTTLAEVLDHISNLGFRPQTVIDVGVAYGTFELHEKFPDSKHLLIEPLKEFEVVLKRICDRYNGDYVLAVASEKPGTAVINVHRGLSGSSLFKEAEGSHIDGIPRKVPALTIHGLCNVRNFG